MAPKKLKVAKKKAAPKKAGPKKAGSSYAGVNKKRLFSPPDPHGPMAN